MQFDSISTHFRRRECFALPFGALAAFSGQQGANALPSKVLNFPQDHGSHNDFRTEWWYLTGWLQATGSSELFGFQVTFFRSRVVAAQSLQSPMAAKHIVLAHVALSDVKRRTLLHSDGLGRFNGQWQAGLATSALHTDTDVRLRNWRLRRTASGYAAEVATPQFSLNLQLATTQPVLLQGQNGLSRKGPDAKQASYYYSQPQLRVSGQLKAPSIDSNVTGTAWLDHEWSQEILHPDAVGWDWIGMNFFDGTALTAFQLRRADGSALWAGGSVRKPTGNVIAFSTGEVQFTPLPGEENRFKSPKTNAVYPTTWQVRTPAGSFQVKAYFADQELDSRSSTQTVYWEGLSELRNESGQPVARGYLEMTGYAAPLRM